MNNTFNFEKDKEYGQTGEDIAFNYLRHLKNTKNVIDVSEDARIFQEYDVDLIFVTLDNQCYLIEVKKDRQTDRTGHICYETWSNGKIGCLARSKADYVFYITDTYLYILELEKIRKYIDTINPQEIEMGDDARGYLLDVSDLEMKGIVLIKYALNRGDTNNNKTA